MPAGPSEVLVIADGTGNADWIAADLLAQAEHDVNAQSILLTDDEELAARKLAKPVTEPSAQRGYAHLFRKTVLQADRGADFDFLAAVEHKGSIPKV